MNNEIGRKITSLTLMTIMVAGGMTFAVPSMMPVQEAHAANANLFVSAENSQFDNYMSGPQVIEVVIINPEISDTDEAKGEPDVTVNGKNLRMVQAVDGNWYGYFSDVQQAQIADFTVNGTSVAAGAGLDFGTFCSNTSGEETLGISLSETRGFALPTVSVESNSTAGVNGTTASPGSSIEVDCAGHGLWTRTNVNGTEDTAMNVLRETKDINKGSSTVGIGQIGVGQDVDVNGDGTTDGDISTSESALNGVWPFIQLYDLNPTGNVVVQYNKGGGAQTTTLTFDTVDQFAGLELDRAKYPQRAEVHFTITDLWLNIDPTDEDSWTFGTNSSGTAANDQGTFYQVFNENGGRAGDDITDGVINIEGNLGDLMCEDNCVLLLDINTQGSTEDVVTLQDNDDIAIEVQNNGDSQDSSDFQTEGSNLLNASPLTVTEQGPSSGIFGSYDESDESNLIITNDAKRGTSATIDYNETGQTIIVGFDFGTIDIQPTDEEWSSGEEIPVVLVDADANKNSRVDEDLDLNVAQNDLIPSLKTGDPFTIGEGISDKDEGLSNFMVFVDTLTPTSLGNKDTQAVVALDHSGTDSGQFVLRFRGSGSSDAGNATTTEVQKFSERAIITPTSLRGDNSTGLIIDLNTNLGDLRSTFKDALNDNDGDFRGLNMLNLDLRGINSTLNNFDVFLLINSTDGVTAGDREIIEDATGEIAGSGSDFLSAISLVNNTSAQALISLNSTSDEVERPISIHESIFDDDFDDGDRIGLFINWNSSDNISDDGNQALGIVSDVSERPFVIDFFSFGFADDGNLSGERVANQIIRIESEETGDNTSTFEGSLEYIMVNQLNILEESTYTGLTTIADDPSFIVIQDLTDDESPRVNYFDLGADGVSTQIADQEEAPSHSGVVSFDANSYKIADTVVVTLEDADLNVDSDLIDIFTTVAGDDEDLATANDTASDAVGKAGLPTTDREGIDFSFGALGRMLDITFDDERWAQSNIAFDGTTCNGDSDSFAGVDDGLENTGFTLIETGTETGIFTGDFQIPSVYCQRSGNTGANGDAVSTTGTDIEVNYVDFRDASGEIIEVGDSAGVRANTGSVSLDRTVYPVPWGALADFGGDTDSSTTNGLSVFPIHATGIDGNVDNTDSDDNTISETLGAGDLTIYVRVNDPDFDVSASGEDTIAQDVGSDDDNEDVGPVKITVSRGSERVVLAYAGGSTENSTGRIDVDDDASDLSEIRQLGEIVEIAPDAGIFELIFDIRYTDGPDSSLCPETDENGFTDLAGTDGTETSRFDAASEGGENYCILQGDIITVEYTDPTDASGDPNTVTDSATFDLRNGVLQSDKSVYIIGSDAILTIIEPDWDLDSDGAETYDLDVLEWDSDAATVTMGDRGGNAAAFDPEPTDFRETGDSTGIFQIVVEVPEELSGDRLERGEEVILEYTDWGPSGSDFVGDEEEDINLTIFTSNFGATVELDQKVYSWTDKVFITIVAPDHNFDSDLVDEIGDSSTDPIKVSTRGNNLDQYKLVETGTDTGIFTGEVILTGFSSHDADGDGDTDDAKGITGNAAETTKTGLGPTDGFLEADDDDGITVSFEFSEDETVVGSALIRWNIGEVQWLEASYPATGTGVVRVVDPDMNLDPEAVDNFDVDVWSDSDAGGIDLTVTETNEATGIFEGTVFFTTTDESSGHRLRVSEGDTVTAEYEDNTLPDPYTTADELDITATSLIGTVVPPLERAPAANARVVDAFGNTLDTVSVDQQVQITADLANGQDREQAFAYLVQIQDANGVTVSLAWITGSLSPGQSFSPALSWIPSQSGTYTATVFVWESVDNPTALSPPVETTINVQ